MSNTAQCAVCHTVLTIKEAAGAEIRCPRCFYRLANPFSAANEGGGRLSVSSFDDDAEFDTRAGRVIAVLLCTLVLVGFIIALAPSMPAAATALVLIVVIPVGGYAAQRLGKRASTEPRIPEAPALSPPLVKAVPVTASALQSPQRSSAPTAPSVLSYYAPRFDDHNSSPGRSILAFMAAAGFYTATTIGLLFLNQPQGNGRPTNYDSQFALFMAMWVIVTIVFLSIGTALGARRRHWAFLYGVLFGILTTGGLCGLLWSTCGNPYAPVF